MSQQDDLPYPAPFVDKFCPMRWRLSEGEHHVLPVNYYIAGKLPVADTETFHSRDIPRYPHISLTTRKHAEEWGFDSEDYIPGHKIAVLDVTEIDESVARFAISEIIGVNPEDIHIEQLGIW